MNMISSTLLRCRGLPFFIARSSPVPRHPSWLSLHFTPTRLANATHRDLGRFRGSSSSWRRPPRPDWLDSLDSKLIFYAIIAVNAGVYLTWELAMQTYVRRSRSLRARLTNRNTAHDRRHYPLEVHARQLSRRYAQRILGSHVREPTFAVLSFHQRSLG